MSRLFDFLAVSCEPYEGTKKLKRANGTKLGQNIFLLYVYCRMLFCLIAKNAVFFLENAVFFCEKDCIFGGHLFSFSAVCISLGL